MKGDKNYHLVIFIHHVYFGLSGEKFKLYPFVQKCTFIICWTLNTPIWIVYLGANIDKRNCTYLIRTLISCASNVTDSF